MHCPKCGVEVVEQAGYCHKCGTRLDAADRSVPSGNREETDSASDTGLVEGQPAEADTEPWRAKPDEPWRAKLDEPWRAKLDEPPPTAGEKLMQAAAHATDDEPEGELWQGGYSGKAMIGAWVLSGLISIVLLIVWAMYVRRTWLWVSLVVVILLLWLYQLGKLCYRRLNVRYRLTTQRFVHETGILRRVTDRIEVIDMDDITFEQTVLARLVGVGTIRITSSDRTHPEIVLLGIENVKEVAGRIDDIRRSERRRRGLHIENI